jgi:hypothetical protein
MFRLFRRPKRRPASPSRDNYRPRLQVLEGRCLPSVSVTPFTDPSGAAALRIIEDGQNDTVTLTDNSTAHTTTVVADGKTQTFNKQFTLFDLELQGKKGALTIDLTGTEKGRHADFQVSLGKGENHFTFNPGLTAITAKSNVNLSVVGHNGNDFVNLSFGDILESRVNVAASNLGGSRQEASSTTPRDVITFGTLRAGIRNSSVDVNVGLGQGNNSLAFNYGSDLGHLAPPAGTPASASDFGPSTFNVSITGSNRRQDAASVTLFANGEVNTASTLNFATQFLAGNNNFKGVIDAANIQIDDDGGQFISGAHSGGAAHFNVHGGSGNDNISFQTINQTHTIEESGLLDVNVVAGAGKDNINVDFGGAGFTDDDPFELHATNRIVRVRVIGGSGDDSINVNLANAATATFAYDVAIQGGSGKNDITFVGNNPMGGMPTFGPSGSVFIDGGPGHQNDVDVSGNFPVEVLNGGL